MSHITHARKRIAFIAGLLTLAASLAWASFGPFVIDWYTADGGGGISSGGAWVVNGTVGQADAGVSSGGPWRLESGFWGNAEAKAAAGMHWKSYE